MPTHHSRTSHERCREQDLLQSKPGNGDKERHSRKYGSIGLPILIYGVLLLRLTGTTIEPSALTCTTNDLYSSPLLYTEITP